MALSKEILEEAELAKNHILNSSLDDRCKKSLLRLLNTTTLATNGLSVEEKIQKITESIHGLILTQITFLDTVDKKIERSLNSILETIDKKIDIANEAKCKDCKAMHYVTTIEDRKSRMQILDDWKAANGIVTTTQEVKEDDSWSTILKKFLLKPYAYVIIGFLMISPYGVEIVRILVNAFVK